MFRILYTNFAISISVISVVTSELRILFHFILLLSPPSHPYSFLFFNKTVLDVTITCAELLMSFCLKNNFLPIFVSISSSEPFILDTRYAEQSDMFNFTVV